MKQDFELTVNLNKIFESLIRNIILIILVTVLCGGGAFAYTSFFVEKEYSASVSIIVDNRSTMDESEKEDASNKKTNTDITASRMLAQTYIAILKNKSVLASVANRVNESSEAIQNGVIGPLSAAKLSSMLTMTPVNDTEILQISAQTTNPQLCVDICYAIVDEAKVVLQRTMNTLTVNSVEGDNILVPSSPVAPNVASNTAIFAFLGFVISCAVFAIIGSFDLRVKATDDISKIIGYPIIGEIPSIKTDAPQKPTKRKKMSFR